MQGRAKVDHFERVKLFVLLKQYVLWLQIAMHYIVLVAVVHHRQDLLHDHGCVMLTQPASLHDLIEEFASFADPAKNK